MKDNYIAQIHLLQAIREFFNSQGFYDVMTPPVVENPGMETHIHPFQLTSAKNKSLHQKYLHTSPEFWMKELLSQGLNKIFTLTYCFRDEPESAIHRPQFIMLEWYRTKEFYTKIMDDCESLIRFTQEYLKNKDIEVINIPSEFKRMTVQELFFEVLNIDILEYLDNDSIIRLIKEKFPDIPLPVEYIEECSWDDYFFLLFLNKVEPELIKFPALILYNYPAHLCALSTINNDDPRVCDRFEIYMDGVELGNCFNELTNKNEQIKRFEVQEKEKQNLYNYKLPQPKSFYTTLDKGLPKSCGIALGVERLLQILTKNKYGFWS